MPETSATLCRLESGSSYVNDATPPHHRSFCLPAGVGSARRNRREPVPGTRSTSTTTGIHRRRSRAGDGRFASRGFVGNPLSSKVPHSGARNGCRRKTMKDVAAARQRAESNSLSSSLKSNFCCPNASSCRTGRIWSPPCSPATVISSAGTCKFASFANATSPSPSLSPTCVRYSLRDIGDAPQDCGLI